MNIISGIRHVAVSGAGLAKTRAFYAGALGLTELHDPSASSGDHAFFTYDSANGRASGSLSVAVNADIGDDPVAASGSGAVVFAAPSGGLASWSDRLADHGVNITGRAWAFGEEHLCFTDPVGLDLALVEDPPADASATTGGANPPRDGLRLRSVELQVYSPQDELLRLLTLLGLQVGARDGPLTRFTVGSVAPIANLDLLCRARRPPWLAQNGRLRRLALEVGSLEALDAMAATLADNAFTLARPTRGGAPIYVKLADGAGLDIALCIADQDLQSLVERQPSS